MTTAGVRTGARLWRPMGPGVIVGAVVLALLWGTGRVADAQAPDCYDETGFCISNPAFQEYFHLRGGVATFGYPISREFTLLGFRVQMFQGHILQQQRDGSVIIMNLLGDDLMPVSRINGSTFPAANPSVINSAPEVGSADYAARIIQFTREVASNEFNGRNVNFSTRS